MKLKLINTKDYLLFIDEEAEIKENVYYFSNQAPRFCIKIEEKDKKYPYVHLNDKGEEVRDFHNWKGVIIAYYPLTKKAKELDLPLLPNPFNLEQYAWDNPILSRKDVFDLFSSVFKDKVLTGAYNISASKQINEFNFKLREISKEKAAQSKQFSLEDIKKAMKYGMYKMKYHTAEAHEEFIQSLITQQVPKEFIPEFDIVHTDHAPNGFEKVFKFKTNSEGKKMLLGAYKY